MLMNCLHVCDVGLVCRDGNCELFVGMGFWNRCVGAIRLFSLECMVNEHVFANLVSLYKSSALTNFGK